MSNYLSSKHYPSTSAADDASLSKQLNAILTDDFKGSYFNLLANYQRLLSDNHQRKIWPDIHHKLDILFKCGKAVPLDGPMIGIPVSIRDSDYFKDIAEKLGEQRSLLASIEWMATAWNATFADTGLWMGKTYEPVSKDIVASICHQDEEFLTLYNEQTTRIGRNFFREPPNPNTLQSIGLPALTELWHLKDRPKSETDYVFDGKFIPQNIEKEKAIPYTKSGGIFIANLGHSCVPEMNNKAVYQLNYRWDKLKPAFPMTKLIDEVVQIADGIYLGQLIFATKHFNLGSFDLPFIPGDQNISLGEPYAPSKKTSFWQKIINAILGRTTPATVDYGYQNNGYFLMMDPAFAKKIYADDAFPQLRPRPGEIGFKELGYDKDADLQRGGSIGNKEIEWENGWRDKPELAEKFTTFILEESPQKEPASEVEHMRHSNESILQMLQRLANDISKQTKFDDHITHFENLHRIFRCGVAPTIKDGLFQGKGKKGFNTRSKGQYIPDWYGQPEPISGFDYYHGATLNLHLGFSDNFSPNLSQAINDSLTFPSALAELVKNNDFRGPNVMDLVWRSIGKYIFPWAGKSYEKISGRKLSMLLDESDDLTERYPARVNQLKTYLASGPHYDLVKKNRDHYWHKPGKYAKYLANGSWDKGMSEEDKAFWNQEANEHWVFGNNIQDKRILPADAIMRIIDMNYREPDPLVQALSEQSGSPFVRQGYVFLGVDEQESILAMNNG
ncbi:MAG TPA: hypothetical protein ENK06_05085, partial [Gammaproteobacteria bacterium]|nr:hypothetical protein [Gammaproteobacteria bacterium]